MKSTSSAFAQASKQLPPKHLARAYLLNDLARWKAGAGDRRGALANAESALAMAREVLPGQPERAAYFALDVGVLRFQNNDCAGAEQTLSSTFKSLPASPMRTQTGLEYVRVLWARGDLQGALATARLLEQASDENAEEIPLLLARLELDAGSIASARRRLDGYRSAHKLSSDDSQWPAPYREAETAYALGVGDLQLALPRARHAVEIAARSPDAAERAAAYHRLGQILSLMGRFAEAERLLSNALQNYQSRAGEVPPDAANVYHDLAWVYRVTGDYPRSAFFFDRALETASRCSSTRDSMPVLMLRERALLQIERRKLKEALEDVDEGLRRIGGVAGDTRVLQALLIAARAFALDKSGDLQGSEQSMQAALDLIRSAEGANSLNLPVGYVHLADLDYRRKRFGSAERQASTALSILDRRGTQSIWGSGAALSLRAAAIASSNAAGNYWTDAGRFVQVTEQSLAPAGAGGSASQSETAQARLQAERLLDTLPAGRDAQQLKTVLQLMQLPHMSDATASVQAAALESQRLPENVRALVRQRAEWLEKSQALRGALSLAQQRGQPVEERFVAQLGSAMDRLARTSEALLRESPSVAGQLLQHTVDAQAVQKALSPTESVLVQVVTEQAVHALLIDSREVNYRSVKVSREKIRENVRQLRRALDLSLPSTQLVPFDAGRANELYRASVGLFARELTGRRKLIVVADDAFQSIPWMVLVDKVSPSGSALSYLAERLSIVTVPSLQSFVALRAVPSNTPAKRPYAAFAAPNFESFRNAVADPSAGAAAAAAIEALRQIRPLPDTKVEVQRIAAVLHATPNDLYLGPRASEQMVSAANLAQYRILSFATHGIMAGEIPGLSEPALVLTRSGSGPTVDGLLTASEIAGLSLHAELVILSACNTGSISSRAGITGISGLARAFFAAGARSLIVSHWSVASQATTQLLARTIELLARDPALDKAEALRQAMLWMKSGKAGAGYTGPAFWASFTLVGESGPISNGPLLALLSRPAIEAS